MFYLCYNFIFDSKMFGRREIVVLGLINSVYNFIRSLFYQVSYITNRGLRQEMKRNRGLKDRYYGERCFIIGNGPSLKYYDLSKLSDEHVFTVNYMMKSQYFDLLQPNFHFFVDPHIFSIDSNNVSDGSRVELIRTTFEHHSETQVFVPYRFKSSATSLLPGRRVHYFFDNLAFTSKTEKCYLIDKNIPNFQNVILYAINAALFMGFKRVFLLGVDMTGFLETFEYSVVNRKWGHVYSKTPHEVENQIINKRTRGHDNEFYLKAYGRTFEQFKIMRDIALKKGALIVNTSRHGALDVFDRADFEDVVNEGRK